MLRCAVRGGPGKSCTPLVTSPSTLLCAHHRTFFTAWQEGKYKDKGKGNVDLYSAYYT